MPRGRSDGTQKFGCRAAITDWWLNYCVDHASGRSLPWAGPPALARRVGQAPAARRPSNTGLSDSDWRSTGAGVGVTSAGSTSARGAMAFIV